MTSPLLVIWAAACGGNNRSVIEDSATDETTPDTETGLLPCAEDRHMVVFDILGLLTVENFEGLGPWAAENVGPTSRPGSVETTQAYRSLGYEILYVTTIPHETFPGRQVADVVSEWLGANGYPMDPEGTHVWVWDGQAGPDNQSWVSITDELLRFAGEDVSVDAGYSENSDKLYAMATGGVPSEQLYSITGPAPASGPQTAPTTPIPGDDMVAHAATVEQLGPVCEVSAG